MQALDTTYKSYKFRSRLEARWAVYFDKVGVKWEYEPAGFKISETRKYLPDFYLPEIETYIEVKHGNYDRKPVFGDMVAMMECGAASIGKCLAVFGDPLDHKLMAVGRIADGEPWCDDFCEQSAIAFEFKGGLPFVCATFNLSAAEKVSVKLKTKPNKIIDNYKEKSAARAARFEHGEAP